MKTIIEQALGASGAVAALVVENGNLEAKISFPVAKIADAVVKPLDPLKEKLKAAIPGNWDDPIIDGLFDAAKAEITKLLTE